MKWSTDEFTGKRFGKYEVLCRLAVGGMAEIFLGFAHQGPSVGRPVVLKRILAEQREDPNAMQMLIDEARTTATLSHANIAQVLDLERAGEDILLVIEFIEGATVEELVEAYHQRGEPVPLGLVLAMVRDAAQGLGHAHVHKGLKGEPQPVVHRDVTPRNIMLDASGATKVLDFGIARAMGGQRRTVAGMVRGTTAYMSPEQAIGQDVDPRSDLFSLGTIFHELLTGQRLFHKGNPAQEMAAVYEQPIPLPSKVNKRVPRAVDTVAMRALERHRDKRYQHAGDFVRELTLAAGSTIWSQQRCAQALKERFTSRLSDIARLAAMIPGGHDAATNVGRVPSYPEGRTMAAGKVPSRRDFGTDEQGARTMVATDPQSAVASLAEVTGKNEPHTEPGRPVPPEVLGPRPTALSAEDLFGDLDGGAERTRIIPGGSMARLPQVPDSSAVPTDTARSAVGRQGPRSGFLLGAALVLALGMVAGGVAWKLLSRRAEVAPMGRLRVESDRPAVVALGQQVIGPTPVDVFVPAGRYTLTLTEEGGAPRYLDAVVDPKAPAMLTVALDSLPDTR